MTDSRSLSETGDIAVNLMERRSPVAHARDITAFVHLVSMGESDIEWLNANAEGWRDHVSVMRVNSRFSIDEISLLTANDPKALLHVVTRSLLTQLAEEIINRVEPVIQGATMGHRIRC